MAEEKEANSKPQGNAFKTWLKFFFFKLGEKAVFKVMTKVLAKVGLSLTGPIGWIASLFADKILKKVWQLFWAGVTFAKEFFQTKKEVKDYKDVVNKPGATAEEIKDAGKDFLSS